MAFITNYATACPAYVPRNFDPFIAEVGFYTADGISALIFTLRRLTSPLHDAVHVLAHRSRHEARILYASPGSQRGVTRFAAVNPHRVAPKAPYFCINAYSERKCIAHSVNVIRACASTGRLVLQRVRSAAELHAPPRFAYLGERTKCKNTLRLMQRAYPYKSLDRFFVKKNILKKTIMRFFSLIMEKDRQEGS